MSCTKASIVLPLRVLREVVQRPSSNSGIAATIEPQVLDDLGTAVSLLKRLARTRLPKEELKHVLSADQLRACKARNSP
jgi:hypothetical protein